MPFTYEFPRPAITADCAIFAMRERDLAVLLVRRKNPPFRGAWALPGGFVNPDEPLERAALRELQEETGIASGIALTQLGAFGDPGRDPRGHTVAIVFYGFVVAAPQPVVAGDDAAEAAWHELQSLPALAFDHAEILRRAHAELRRRLKQEPASLAFPTRFTLSELHTVYEAVLGESIPPRSFRSRVVAREMVEPAPGARGGKRGKRGATQLYRFRARA